MGGVYSDLGQDQKALEYYQQALGIAHEIGDREGEVIDLHNIGFLYEELGDTAQAIHFFQQAVEVLESIQGEITVGELKASLAGERASTYENLISLLWEEGRSAEALNYAERARARAFLDQLAGGIIDFRAGADANLLEREQALRNEIIALHTELVTLRGRPTNELDTEAIAAIETKLKKQESDYSQLLTEIKLQSPEVAGLVSVDVASLSDIQSLLDSDTTLVEYFVMEDRTLAFIISVHHHQGFV